MSTETVAERFRQALADRYQLGAEIGWGATATVYAALDVKHQRQVAIKFLRPELAATMTGERFLREITIAAKLQHPHIVPVLDSGEAAGSCYFVMPVVEGETLRSRLNRGDRLTVTETVRILADLADALAYAHRHGVIHRDIKPDNIMLAGRHAMIMDFGVAKALSDALPTDRNLTSGLALGTPSYMAPEQAMADPALDRRVDLYALGIVGYEILTGRPPFVGSTPQDILTAQVVQTPEPIQSHRSDLPAPVAELIDRCLSKQRDARWQSAEEIVERLEAVVLTPTGGSAPVDGTMVGRPRRWAFSVAIVLGTVGVIALVSDLRLRGRTAAAPPPRPERLSFLGTVREAAFSPDGTMLAYVTATSTGQDLWVQELRGGTPIKIASSERIVGVTWTSQGTELSYAEGPAEAPVTRLASRLGGASRVVAKGRGLVSPNGKLVLIATGGDPNLVVVRMAEGDTIRLHRPPDGYMSGIAWSPSSDRLVLSTIAPDRSHSSIALLGLDDRSHPLKVERRAVYGVTWSPNGKSVYYLANAKASGRDLMRLDVGGDKASEPMLVAVGLSAADEARRYPTGTFLSVTRDGSHIVFVREEAWSNLARFRVKPSRPQPMNAPELFTMGTALYSMPRLSPDGTRLAVFVSTAGGASLSTVAVDGNELDRVAVVDVPGSLAWSPDGITIAYTAGVADSGLRLTVSQTTSGTARRTPGPVGLDLAWGGAVVVVLEPGSHGLLRVDPATATIRGRAIGDSAATFFGPRVSPDGRWVAVTSYRGSNGPVALTIWHVGDSTARAQVVGAYRPVGWSADSKTVYAVRNVFAPAPETLVAIAVTGGVPRPVATLPSGFAIEDVSGDGRLVIASQVQSQSDSWQLSLPKTER